MDRYTHLGLIDIAAALQSLPTIATSDANQCRATGTSDTTGNGSNLSCTKSCNTSTEISHSQPLSPVLMPTEAVSGQDVLSLLGFVSQNGKRGV